MWGIRAPIRSRSTSLMSLSSSLWPGMASGPTLRQPVHTACLLPPSSIGCWRIPLQILGGLEARKCASSCAMLEAVPRPFVHPVLATRLPVPASQKGRRPCNTAVGSVSRLAGWASRCNHNAYIAAPARFLWALPLSCQVDRGAVGDRPSVNEKRAVCLLSPIKRPRPVPHYSPLHLPFFTLHFTS